jgi:(p)ppGpp synthase/HD superfamily hydrolase
LHDTIEDTNTTYDELVQEFGEEVAKVVMEVRFSVSAGDFKQKLTM